MSETIELAHRSKAKAVWLDRMAAPALPHLCLATSQEEFNRALSDLGVTGEHRLFVNPGSHATTWQFESGGRLACIVALDCNHDDPIEIACLLVHEAVHVWQAYCDRILNEDKSSDEQEAYAIQFISAKLMHEYARRIGGAA